MNHDLGYLDQHLVALRDSYALRAVLMADDAARLATLTDHYLRDAMVLLSTAHGPAAADHVRAARRRDRRRRPAREVAAPSPRSARAPGPIHGPYALALRYVMRALRDTTLEWHNQVLAMAGRHAAPAPWRI